MDTCQRTIVHVHDLEAWWKKPASGNPKNTNWEQFVYGLPLLPGRNLPITPKKIFGGGQSRLRILSLLIRQKRDRLIDCFYEANMHDHYMDRSEDYQRLREQLADVVRKEEVEPIINAFHKEKWEFCPLTLTSDMSIDLRGMEVIPPFCMKIKLPKKGGTASIYWVAVQKALVSDDALALALKDSLYMDKTHGECYQMVLKSYCGNKKQDFDMEKAAFSALPSNDQVPIVRCFGAYIHDHGEGENMGTTYNLLLEYGENDLLKKFFRIGNLCSTSPRPSVNFIIRSFPEAAESPGDSMASWHADIKPDNILSVRGQLKLSDFGFSSFAPVIEGQDSSEPTDVIRGYTNTYGAPEVSRMVQPDGTMSGVSQSIDAWSFGSLREYSKDTDPVVMKALSSIEEEAQIQRFSEPQTNLLQQPLLQVNPRERASMQIRKGDLIRNKPLGQTAHRKEILKEKLEDCYGTKTIESSPLIAGLHNGAVTESPIDSNPSRGLQFGGRKIKPRHPQIHKSEPVSIAGKEAYSNDPFVTNSRGSSFGVGLRSSANLGRLSLQDPKAESPSTKYSTSLVQPHGTSISPSPPEDKYLTLQNSDFMVEKEAHTTGSPPLTPINIAHEHKITHNHVPSIDHLVNRQSYGGSAPIAFDTSPTSPSFDDKLVEELEIGASGETETIGNSRPSVIVSPAVDAQSSQYQPATPNLSTHVPEMQALHNPTSARSYDDSALPLPQSALELPYNICLKRKAMEEQVSKGVVKGFTKLKSTLGFETRSRDASLEDTFSDPREIMLVIDNGWTMCKHWPIVTFVAQTLAMNAAGLDRDGFDVKFTVDGRTHDQQRLRGDRGRKKLKKALKAAWPEQKPNDNTTTDMAQIFQTIFGEWKQTGKPATTLLVLTDGVWSNENTATFDKIILDIARLEQRPGGSRHFSIQFIRFDDGLPEKIRLQWLDDHLCAKNGLKDIIDHCSWRADVEKLLTGSIEVFADNHNSVDPPMLYDYEELAGLFNTFNRGGDALLSPTSTPSRTPSRASKRLSISNSFTEDWTKRG
ncbi:uncharacterized protein J4E84_003543 [Alternaria hordeiaustralica]|uniref:uncharacterized protein n=1 Tax=Alternaria hordeiaustralica TaxID=1187925 RepID=UPI0020C49001|nr:uncharacterized protein J4E84_003543 [Alternaria hordeiaustralica]KAI4691252.1 hypothetical protein J4E84_003543 [Alternaria hordeiaustralica]